MSSDDSTTRAAAADGAHWNDRYSQHAVETLSWYEPRPERSLELIAGTGPGHEARILDVGGGASSLAEHLLGMGYTDITVADISAGALAQARVRLGREARRITWVKADIRTHDFHRRYDIWHDRAVFHFMVAPAEREGYLASLRRALRPGGHLIIATFGPQGPTQCSGLPVVRYSVESLVGVLGDEFALCSSVLAEHRTPSGGSQQFLYAHLTRHGSP